jgi:cell division septal protein FtsQ
MIDNYHEILTLNLTRAFPDTVVATIALRKAVAQLYQEYYYPVDRDGVILSGVKDSPLNTLPVINGVYANLSTQVGKLVDSNQLKKTLLLLKELKSSGILNEHTLMAIDISNIRNAVFFLENGLEVKVGYEDFALRLENLKKVLRDPKLKPTDVKYIDLRFREPVIGLKWKK